MEEEQRLPVEVNPRLDSVTGGLAFSAATVTYILASFIAGIIISAASLGQGTDGYIYVSYLAAPIAIAASCAFILRFRKVGIRQVVQFKCKPKYYVIGLMLVFGLLFSLDWVNTAAVKFFELFGYKQRAAENYLPDLSGGLIVPALIVIALLPSVFEELLFRGVILNSCEQSAGSVRSVFIVGFCFSLFHCSPEQTVYQFIAGCVFSFIAVRSRSILPSAVMHFINNSLIVILSACGAIGSDGNLNIPQAGSIALTVIGACSLVGGIIWLIFDKTPVLKCAKGGVKYFFLSAAVGIVILAVMWLCSLFGVA